MYNLKEAQLLDDAWQSDAANNEYRGNDDHRSWRLETSTRDLHTVKSIS